MQQKYFKCSFCKADNSYIVPFSEKGKWCRCCQAYNYFDSNNGTKIDNNFNNNNNNNKHCYKYNKRNIRKKLKRKKINLIRSKIYTIQTIGNIPINNNISNNEFNFNINIISNNFNKNENNNIQNSINHNIINPQFNFNINTNNNAENNINNNNRNEREEEDECICSIWLDNFQTNNDIKVLICGHTFHSSCIENLLAHNNNKCPNCRCNLITGERQLINNNTQYQFFNNNLNYNNNNSYYRLNGDSRYQLFDDIYNHNDEINDNPFYSRYDEYADYKNEHNK